MIDSNTLKSLKFLITAGILVLAGVAGNHFALHLYFGVNFFFGSIVVLIALYLFGLPRGMVIAVLVSTLTFFIWHTHQSLVIFPLEALFVGLFLNKRDENIIVADAFFWTIIGLPLLGLLNYKIMHFGLSTTLFTTLKVSVNGIFNALLANLFVTFVPVKKWLGAEPIKSHPKHLSLNQIIFNLLLAFILFPAMVFMVFDNHREKTEIEAEVVNHFKADSIQITSQMLDWQEVDGQFAGYAYGSLQLDQIRALLKISSHEGIFDATVTDRKGLVIASTRDDLKTMQKFNLRSGSGEKQLVEKNVYHLLPADKSLSESERWKKSFYLMEAPIGRGSPWKLTIEIPFSPYYDELQDSIMKKLAGVLVLAVLALILAKLISRRLTEPLSRLAVVTTNLPVKLFLHQSVDWPASSINEIDSLIGNFHSMSGTFQENFAELQTAIQRSEGDRNKLEAIIAGIGDGISIQDTDFRVLYQNQAHKDMAGEQTGEYCYKAYEDKDEVCEGCPLAASYKDGKVHQAERFGKAYVEITVSPIKDANGNITSGIEVVRNITDRKQAEETMRTQQARLQEQLAFENALNQIAETMIAHDDTRIILESAADILGKTLGVDRSLIYDINLEQQLVIGLCESLNPAIPEIAATKETYDLKVFEASIRDGMENRQWLESHKDEINPLLLSDGSGEKLHHVMNIQSLLWYPFAFRPNGFYALIFNQLSHRRQWRKEEIEFLNAASKQVELAIQKILLLEEHKHSELVMWEEKERAQVTLHSIGDAVITTDAEGNVEYLNPVAEDLTGWPNAEAHGLPLFKVFHIINEQTGALAENPVETCLREGRIVGLANHTLLIHRDGHEFAIEDSAAPLKNREGQIVGAVMVFHDVSEKRNLLQQMVHQAYHDPLTDLPNRILFNDRLTLALAQAARNNEMLAVLFLDLDHFKMVNDILGHAMGDTVLKNVAHKLSDCLRDSDTVARLGGDEFTLLLPQIEHEEDAAKVAQKILQIFQEPFFLSGHEFHITTSIGIALYPNDGNDADTLMKHADTAMYRAKENNRNNYQLFTPSMNTRISERLAMENDLRRALIRKEFVVHYQPLINIESGRFTGVEALIRWLPRGRNLLLPDEFLPLAEETGLIIPIGDWVLHTACAQNKAWQDAGLPPIKVTVNISACQFKQENLVETVSRALRETGLAPCWLELEITEGIIMHDIDYTISVLRELNEMGVQVAIDDFGTGYSSFKYLKHFPIHTLKIDRYFINNIPGNSDDAAIVTSIIILAKNLNLKVVAEGVETKEQLAFLKEQHCLDMQGFLFGKTQPPEDIKKVLERIV